MGYSSIFFDLDHTLWDYDTSAIQTLNELYIRHGLDGYGASNVEALIESFFKVNEDLWEKYNHGKISKYFLRTERFKLVFDSIGVNFSLCPDDVLKQFNDDYLYECPKKGNLIDGAINILDALKSSYNLHIITNGFEEIQKTKLKYAGLEDYFDVVVTSEKAGAKKPYAQIFEFALKQTGTSVKESIMIGDNISTDIIGARNYGMDQVYFNPEKLAHQESVTHEIHHLKDLSLIL